jgi:hypothetical protein
MRPEARPEGEADPTAVLTQRPRRALGGFQSQLYRARAFWQQNEPEGGHRTWQTAARFLRTAP